MLFLKNKEVVAYLFIPRECFSKRVLPREDDDAGQPF